MSVRQADSVPMCLRHFCALQFVTVVPQNDKYFLFAKFIHYNAAKQQRFFGAAMKCSPSGAVFGRRYLGVPRAEIHGHFKASDFFVARPKLLCGSI